MSEQQLEAPRQELKWLTYTADFLDNRFRIPGTNIRFGIDFLIGLIPYIGDVISFVISGLLVILMVRKGASGKVLFKMLMNIWIDGMAGTLPILGDIFDLRYRANTRNLRLLEEYYVDGKHGGSPWVLILLIVLSLFLLILLSVVVIWKVMGWFWSGLLG